MNKKYIITMMLALGLLANDKPLQAEIDTTALTLYAGMGLGCLGFNYVSTKVAQSTGEAFSRTFRIASGLGAGASAITLALLSGKAKGVLEHAYNLAAGAVAGYSFGNILVELARLVGWLDYLERYARGQSINQDNNANFPQNKNTQNMSNANGDGEWRVHYPGQIDMNFNSVAGMEEVKEELQDIVDYLKDPEKYHRLGAKMCKGVLLVGPPGNGKTFIARALAGEADCAFISVSGSEFVEKYVGVGAARVRSLFAQARDNKPCIIFIDEVDAVGGKRTSNDGGGGQEHNHTLNQLLTEMDGFDSKNEPIIIIAATNRVDMLDDALLRPGRFDRQVKVSNPRMADRLKILKLHAQKVVLDPTVDLERVARGTAGFSAAQLANLINEAAITATRENKSAIFMAHFEEARDKIIVGKKWKAEDKNKDKETLAMTAYHEAGHALMHILQPDHAMPLHKVTIAARGDALGIAWGLPEGDVFKKTKEELLADIKICMAGRAAEELVFGKYGTGASNDFKQATTAAKAMVTRYGMSDELGPVSYTGSISGETAELIDKEVRRICKECMADVKNTLKANRDKLDRLAKGLLEDETLDASEVYALLGLPPRISQRLA